MTFSAALPGTAAPGATASEGLAAAEALTRALPGPPLMVQRHAGPPPAADLLAGGVSATYVGARSADFALVVLDRAELVAAGGGGAVRVVDVLRPALQAAGATVGGGMLGEAADGADPALFASPDATVFDLVGEAGLAGWLAVQVRAAGNSAPRAFGGDMLPKLGRISNVEMMLTVEIGRARVSVRDLLGAQPGTVIELDRAVGSEADVFLNGRLIAHGEIVVVDQQFAVRVTAVLDAADEQ